MTYHVAVIFLIFHFIAVAMLATVWDMGRSFLCGAKTVRVATFRPGPLFVKGSI